MINKVMIDMARRVTPKLIAQDMVGVQPMTGPIGSIFTMKDNVQERFVKLEEQVCSAMTAFEESWMDKFMEDQMLLKPMVWCLRELAGMSKEGIYKKPTTERLDRVEAEYNTMTAWLGQAHKEIAFDFEMRGLIKESSDG